MAKSNSFPLIAGAAAVFLLMSRSGSGNGSGTGGGSESDGEGGGAVSGGWDPTRDPEWVIDRLNSVEVSVTASTIKGIALSIAHDLFPDFPQTEGAAVDYVKSQPGQSIWAGVTATISDATGIAVSPLVRRTGGIQMQSVALD